MAQQDIIFAVGLVVLCIIEIIGLLIEGPPRPASPDFHSDILRKRLNARLGRG